MFRQPTETCPPPWRTSCSKESEVSECWSANTLDTDCLVSRLKVGNFCVFHVFVCFLTQGTLCCFDGCADVCLPPTESCRQVIFNPWIKNVASNVVLIFKVTEIIEEPKIEIVMKPVCVPIAIEDCTEEVKIGFQISIFLNLGRWRSAKACQWRNAWMSESQPRTRFNRIGAYGVLISFSQDSQDRPTECPPPSKEKCDPATSIANCWSPGSEVKKSTCSQFTFMLVPRRKTFKITFLSRMLTV